ncbi:MAG: DUF3618 domain-containing protein [Actinomycetota bacterium]|nr:DUF3618 domain-containing protein [Actinomycetota bacterium]
MATGDLTDGPPAAEVPDAGGGQPATMKPARTDRSGGAAGPGSGGNDPEQLVAEIERTREELAGTLDAIAEKVSPKRAASRTGKKLAAAVSEGAETVKEGAANAKEAVKDGAASAKEALKDGAATAKDALTDKLPEAVAAHLPGHHENAPATSGPARATSGPSASLTAATPGPYQPVPSALPPASSGDSRHLAAAAAGAAAVVLGLLVLRRRRRRQ